MSWNQRSLGSLLAPSGYDRAGNNDYPVLSITMKQGLVDQSDKFKKRVASKDTAKYRVAYIDELVVGFPIDEGVLGFQTKYPAGIVSPAYNIWQLTDQQNTHIPYVERYLRSSQARHLYASKMQGAVARRRSLTKADFLKLEIPFPPIDDQKRIAHLLGKVEGMITQRKQHLQQLDDLIKSVFLDMFGDPVRNEMGWVSTTIGDLANEVKYGTSASAQGGKYKYLRMNNITQDGYWDFESIKYIDVDDKDFEKYSLRKGDLVFNRTNSKELVGKTAVYDHDEPVVIAGYLIRVRFKSETNPWFVWGHLNSKFGKTRLFNLCRNIVGMANINAKELQAIPILKPPIDLQNQFAAIVENVGTIKTCYQHSLDELENIFGALSQMAFKGELDLSRVPLPDEIAHMEYAVKINDIDAAYDQVKINEYPMSDPGARRSLLQSLFETYLKDLEGLPISLEDFWQQVNLKTIDLMDEFDKPWNVDDYDQLKQWVFERISDGRIEQAFVDDINEVQLKTKT